MLYLALYIGKEEAVRVYNTREGYWTGPDFERADHYFTDPGEVIGWLKGAYRLALNQPDATLVCGPMSDDEFDALKILFPRVDVTRGHCYY